MKNTKSVHINKLKIELVWDCYDFHSSFIKSSFLIIVIEFFQIIVFFLLTKWIDLICCDNFYSNATFHRWLIRLMILFSFVSSLDIGFWYMWKWSFHWTVLFLLSIESINWLFSNCWECSTWWWTRYYDKIILFSFILI